MAGDDVAAAAAAQEEQRRLDEQRRLKEQHRQEEEAWANAERLRAQHAPTADAGNEAFRMYDADRNGLISARELHRVLRQLGDKCSIADCSRMIRSVDGDGSVNFDEFKKMMGAGAGARR